MIYSSWSHKTHGVRCKNHDFSSDMADAESDNCRSFAGVELRLLAASCNTTTHFNNSRLFAVFVSSAPASLLKHSPNNFAPVLYLCSDPRRCRSLHRHAIRTGHKSSQWLCDCHWPCVLRLGHIRAIWSQFLRIFTDHRQLQFYYIFRALRIFHLSLCSPNERLRCFRCSKFSDGETTREQLSNHQRHIFRVNAVNFVGS